MGINKKIIVAVLVIGASGVINSWLNKKPITPVIIGSYVFLLVLAGIDMFGGPLAQLASSLAMIAMLTVVLTEFPWQAITGLLQGKPGTPLPGGIQNTPTTPFRGV